MERLVTGEAVVLELNPARLPSRMLAFVIDLVLRSFIGFCCVVLLGVIAVITGWDDDEAVGATAAVLVWALVFLGYPALFESITRGRSPGKAALGLRVVRDDGGPVAGRHTLIRALAGALVDFGITFGAGALLCAMFSRTGKRIGDVLAGTIVVRERVESVGGADTAPVPMPPQLAGWAAGLELSRLPDSTALLVRQYLARYPQLAPAARDGMGFQLAEQVAGYIGRAVPAGVPAWAYLAAVVAERRNRELARHLARQQQAGPTMGAATPEQAPAGRPVWRPSENPFGGRGSGTAGGGGPEADPAPESTTGFAPPR